MSRFWIGLAMVLCFGANAVADDAPSQVPQWFPSAVKAKADAATDPAPMPVVVTKHSSAALSVAPERNREPDNVLVVQLRNAPATQLAQTLRTVFEREQRPGMFDASPNAKIVPEVVSNCLVVAGPSELVHKVEALIDKLDRAAVMIRLEVLMGDVPAAIVPAAEAGTRADLHTVHASVADAEEARKKMEVLFQAELSTLDNQPACLNAGRREPTISAVNMSYGGGPFASPAGRPGSPPAMQQSNSVTMQNLGTILSLTPRANAEGVVAMQLAFEDSRLAPANEGVPLFIPSKGEPVRSPVVETLKVQTTIKVANGQTVLLSDFSRKPKEGKQRVILVTVHVFPIGDQAKRLGTK
jgi:type II secretory pathway component GspD/PulD (secretin)